MAENDETLEEQVTPAGPGSPTMPPPDPADMPPPDGNTMRAALRALAATLEIPPPVGDLPENRPDNQPRRLRWSPSAKDGEGAWVDDFTIPEGAVLVRWCRVDQGIVQDTPIWVYTNPNDSECNLPGTWYLCPDEAVQNKYLYDVNTGVFSPPPPWDPPPEYIGTPAMAAAESETLTGSLIEAIKNDRELRRTLRELLRDEEEPG